MSNRPAKETDVPFLNLIRSLVLLLVTLFTVAPAFADARVYFDGSGNQVPGVVPLVGCADKANCTGAVSASNPMPVTSSGGSSPSVGAAAINTGQWSNATGSATQIVAARTGAAGTGRSSLTLFNSGSVAIFYGNVGVTSSTGTRLLPGGSRTLYVTAAIYGVPASGTGTVDFDEEY